MSQLWKTLRPGADKISMSELKLHNNEEHHNLYVFFDTVVVNLWHAGQKVHQTHDLGNPQLIHLNSLQK
jgi:hypothetical protein